MAAGGRLVAERIAGQDLVDVPAAKMKVKVQK
jgi:hypothetical protein